MLKKDRRTAGFTLIELMIVIAILGLMAYMVAPRLMGVMGKAKPKIALADIKNLETALDMFYLDVGRYPSQDEGLKVLYQRSDNIPNWAGPYIKKAPKDPWGRDYVYKFPGELGGAYDIISYGADGQPGGEGEAADVTN
ncbi:MAG: type II secretion system major pseudopilin GspG [Desulfobaccales bacterium]